MNRKELTKTFMMILVFKIFSKKISAVRVTIVPRMSQQE